MKRFYSLSLGALLVVLMAGSGASGPANAQTDEQNAHATNSKEEKGNNQSDGLRQRTGIPFQITQPPEGTLPLLAIMINMEQNMAALQAGHLI
ncbi:hypothetical protein [Marinobacter sp.]|uniref:hypothetical protein n=1 Tax=Marinobacter sp. TaxID=50741 RepID=UPI00384F01A2